MTSSGTKRLPNYGIRAGYKHRLENRQWNDHGTRGRFQKPVYELTRDLMTREGLRSVLDIGCGSGWKLVHILGGFDTTGTDLPVNLDSCREQYPDRKWLLSDLSKPCPLRSVDVVMSADVIEHIPDPDILMDYLAGIECKWIVLSTPDRDRARGKGAMGPPANEHHVREWNPEEFHNYVSQWCDIAETHAMQESTHTVVCRPRPGRPSPATRELFPLPEEVDE